MSEPDTPSTFADLLRHHRVAAGFSQEELAERANVSLAAVSALERGTRRAPQRQTVELLLDGLALRDAARAELLEAASHTRTRLPPKRAADSISRRTNALNLPLYLTSFIARESEIADLRTLTQDCRLLTIVGAGGIGKTRLACEVAGRLAGSFDLVAFADLAPLIEDGMLVPYIASIFEVEVHTGPAIAAIAAELADRPALLILDNCERLLEATAAAVTALLRSAPNLTIVATSRERLAVGGEWIYRLRPLEVPPREHGAAEEALQAPALQLFVNRAQVAEPEFVLRNEDLADVVDICRRLDGIPLAIELAVARLPALGVGQLRRRLDHQFSSAAGYRDAPARHQTMHATIAWSFDLLDTQEQTLLNRAGIFTGGFTLEGAELVCTDEAVEAADVLRLLSRLVEKSLLLVNHEGESSRYRLLDSVRLFSLEQLAKTGRLDTIARRHAEWLVERAAATSAEMSQGVLNGPATLQMVAELDNIRGALGRLLASEDTSDLVLAARIAGGLRRIWTRLSLLDEGTRWASEILSKLNSNDDAKLAALVMRLQLNTGPQPPNRQVIEQAAEIFSAAGDYDVLSNMYNGIMLSAAEVGDFDLAEAASHEAARLFAGGQATNEVFYAYHLTLLAHLHAVQGRLAEARAVVSSAEAAGDSQSNPAIHSSRRQMHARIEAIAGNYATSITLELEALSMMNAEGAFLLEHTYSNLAQYYFLNGDIDRCAIALRNAVSSGQSQQNTANPDIFLMAAAIAASRDAMDAAARFKGFYDSYVTSKQGAYRNPLQLRIDENVETAFSRADFAERAPFSLLGEKMSVAEARKLALTL